MASSNISDHGLKCASSVLNAGSSDGNGGNKDVLRRLKTASILCSIFIVVEVIGGYVSGSLAVLSDAAHLFSDLAAFVVAIGVAHVAELPPSERNTYGYKRAEALGALFSMSSLAVVSLILLVEAFDRLWKNMTMPADLNGQAVDGKVMSYIAGFGVLVNVCLAFILKENHVHLPGYHDHSHDHGHDNAGHSHSHDHSNGDSQDVQVEVSRNANGNSCSHTTNVQDDKSVIADGKLFKQPSFLHSHDHNHSHDPEVQDLTGCGASKSQKPSYGSTSPQIDEEYPIHVDETTPIIRNNETATKNVNLNAAYVHVIGDLIQSVAVLIAGLVIYFKPTWYIVDTICTILFCLLVGYSCFGIMKSSISVLLNEVPPNVNWPKVYATISSIKGITNVHDLHIWSISHDTPILSVHASADNVENALHDISKVCQEQFGIRHSTIQLQPTHVDSCVTCDVE